MDLLAPPAFLGENHPHQTPVGLVGVALHGSALLQSVEDGADPWMRQMQRLGQLALADAVIAREQRQRHDFRKLHSVLSDRAGHHEPVEMHHPAERVKHPGGERVDVLEVGLG